MMKRVAAFLGLLILGLVIFASIAFVARASFTSFILSRGMNHVDVNIAKIDLFKGRVQVHNFEITNPKKSQTPLAFEALRINLWATWQGIFNDPFTIEEIAIDDAQINLEMYNSSGTENNWSIILDEDEDQSQQSQKKYLIQKLSFSNLLVQTVDMNGNVTTYPVIDHLEFYNISEETGFPIDEIEKAVFQVVLRSVFQRFGLENLLKSLNPGNWIPDFIPLPFFREKKDSIPKYPKTTKPFKTRLLHK